MARARIPDTVATDVLYRLLRMAGAMEGRVTEVVGAGVVGADITAKVGVGDGEY